ncbi:uncharacterized protein LOC116211940 [Punica granatum]|uniref:Uncharacterized protein LOC116211940 n=1 Tax=Punica granatum TaxID=22663 RepID=A0A6P8EAP7_PUNGR|nr:uncharacterized protein LOC116211940 [Punica granatum]
MAKSLVRYSVVDAFTDSPFKGNPAAVCFLEEEKADDWLQAVATEFKISQTCYLTRTSGPARFGLRWFTPVAEVKLCGHATLAAAHSLLSSASVDSDVIEFKTLSGILTAKRVPEVKTPCISVTQNGEAACFFIELDFPMVPVSDYSGGQWALISKALNGTSVIEMKMTAADDLLVVFSSAEEVENFQPQFDEIEKCPGRGLLITAAAPPDSSFDFYSRFFCPKLGIYEDPVCGSAHCALAPYWCEKLRKDQFIANAASPRGGVLHLQLDKRNQRMLLRGKAVTVMEGSLLV